MFKLLHTLCGPALSLSTATATSPGISYRKSKKNGWEMSAGHSYRAKEIITTRNLQLCFLQSVPVPVFLRLLSTYTVSRFSMMIILVPSFFLLPLQRRSQYSHNSCSTCYIASQITRYKILQDLKRNREQKEMNIFPGFQCTSRTFCKRYNILL